MLRHCHEAKKRKTISSFGISGFVVKLKKRFNGIQHGMQRINMGDRQMGIAELYSI